MKRRSRSFLLFLLCVATILLLTSCAKKCEVDGCSRVVLDSEKGTLCSTHIKQYYEEAKTEYAVNMAKEISDSIKASSTRNIIQSVNADIVFELEEYRGWWDQTEILTVVIKVDDDYDNYKFSKQYDIAYSWFELAEDVREKKEDSYALMNKWLRGDMAIQVGKAYGYESFSTNNYDVEFCVQTTTSEYVCSDFQGGKYFKINGKEYWSTLFDEAYLPGSTKNRKECEVCTREGTYKYESFTGQTEYYCYKHYQELKDMLNNFGLD